MLSTTADEDWDWSSFPDNNKNFKNSVTEGEVEATCLLHWPGSSILPK